ncbi:T9SS type A sorting domain-containing protein [Flavobacterium sp. NRK F7]|uniref:T9SS type A sorting domain-containing protein n=1 Tax=Flavobacterium sp. NRK F7 TaxID=2954930 RepID=UPI002091D5E5|nr:T9SS type A sorting domain-containing protein [Flavobacterium sp. NRK F7]MCO6163106.1 T9SS type A sorting domain-containing protein [Flavobacterium sp. NRK F7]
MRKNILLLSFFIATLTSFSQNILITDLTTRNMTGGINVNVKTVSGTGSGYLSNSYTINGNIIDLDVCYWFDDTLPILYFDNDFFIPITTEGNYTINVRIILSSSQVTCDYYANTDNQTTSETYLSAAPFESNKIQFLLFPNPTNGKLEYTIKDAIINQITVFDCVGSLVKEINRVSKNHIDLSELNDGVYFLKIQTDSGILNDKVIIRK